MPIIIVKEAGKKAEKRELPTLDLQTMQGIVGGSIEYIPCPGLPEYDMFLNEEGKFIETCFPNIILPHDIIMGTVFVCNHDQEGNSVGLTEQQAEQVITLFDEHLICPIA